MTNQPMSVRQLWWELTKHILHRRGRDEAFVSIVLENDRRTLGLTGPVVDFRWESDADAFCFIEAVCEDSDPWTEDPPFIGDLIEASSLGTPEAKALRDSLPDEQVDRIMARVRELDGRNR